MQRVSAQSLPSPACFSSTHCQGLTASIYFQHHCKLIRKTFFSFLCAYSRWAISNACPAAAVLLTPISILKPHLSRPCSFQEGSIATWVPKSDELPIQNISQVCLPANCYPMSELGTAVGWYQGTRMAVPRTQNCAVFMGSRQLTEDRGKNFRNLC